MTYWKYLLRFGSCVILFTVLSSSSNSQTRPFSGYVLEIATHQPISHAIVLLKETGQQESTNDEGHFNFEPLPVGKYTLSIHHIAYARIERRITLSFSDPDTLIVEMHSALFPSDEVIIRSTRTSSNIKNTPYPVDVLVDEQLMESPNLTISEALHHDPGIVLVRDGTWETAVSIRGMSPKNIVSLVDNTRIETASDIAGSLSLININDLERVEILKSPGSVLFGTGALGGVLHLVTKRASFSDQLQMNAEWSSGLTGVDDGISHYLALERSSDIVAMRISGGYRKAGNTATPNGILLNSHYKDFSLNGSIGIKTIGNQSLFISYQRSQAEDTGIPGNSAFGATAAVRYVLARRELFNAEYTLPNLSSIIPLLSIRLSRQEIRRNVEVLQGDTLKITPHAIHITNSIQIESNICPMSDHFLVVGAEVWQRELDSRREKSLLNKKKLIGERPIPPSKFFSGGIYAQDEWTLVPHQLTATLGARYDWIRIKNDKVYNPEYDITAGVLRVHSADSEILWKNGSAHNESWSANAGVQYSCNSYLDFTFLAATAFRSPSLEERYQFLDLGNGNLQVGNPNLQPERSVCFNTGFRIHPEGLKIQLDLFINQLKNLIKGMPGIFENRSALINTNIAQARLYGYEIYCEKSLTSWSTLKGSLAYVRGEDTYVHANLPQIAPLSGEMELDGYFQNIGTLNFSCSGMAAQEHLAAGEVHTAGYVIFNINAVSIPLQAGHWSVTLKTGLQNIFNTAYRNHLSTLRGIIKEEPGRNYYLSTTVTF
jgi:hemoglobin/transferrin/lactoferrin receptor protein